MFNYNKEMKKMENQQQATEQLNQLNNSLKQVTKMVDEFRNDAKDCLLNNDQAGFELIANSIFYFQDIQKILQTIKVQFQTYVKTSQFMDTIEGVRPILKNTAKLMAASPSFTKNNKDFMKFKKGLMRGQLNMKAMTSMMSTINPATETTRSKEEFSALKESLLVGTNTVPTSTVTNSSTQNEKETASLGNEDFFSAINED